MKIHLLRLKSWPIYRQLELEEALLRSDERSFFLLNAGSTPACVLGISSNLSDMVEVDEAKRVNLPIIRRFSGGGTVVVDEQTCFSTFILQGHSNPSALHAFAAAFFVQVFQDLPFSLHQNDYRLNDKKIGGNAQYFTKDRALHHTSFLFDWNKERMNLLKMPLKRPQYRENRGHEEFLTPLKDYFLTVDKVLDRIESVFKSTFDVVDVTYEEVEGVLAREHRKSLRKETA